MFLSFVQISKLNTKLWPRQKLKRNKKNKRKRQPKNENDMYPLFCFLSFVVFSFRF